MFSSVIVASACWRVGVEVEDLVTIWAGGGNPQVAAVGGLPPGEWQGEPSMEDVSEVLSAAQEQVDTARCCR